MTTLQPVEFGGRPIGKARRLPDSPAPPTEDAPPAPPGPEGYEADWNIDQVLEWVDDEGQPADVRSDRAKAAVVAEHDREKPRKTLLTELETRTG